MTVQNEDYRMDYNGDGVQTAFPVTFYFLQDTDLKVILVANDGTETTLIITTDYTVAGAGNPSGGTVTLITPPAADESLAILRDMELTQLTDYVENDNFPAESHETALDKLTMIVQQQNEQLDRSITVSEGVTIQVNLPLPDVKKALKWNDAGDNLANSIYDIDTQQAAAEAAQAGAEAAEAGAVSAENSAAQSSGKAALWANEAEDVEVEPGEYSAFHWSQKAQEFSTGFPSGTTMVFYQASPPPGWVLQDVGDVVLGVSNGTTKRYDGANPGNEAGNAWNDVTYLNVVTNVSTSVSIASAPDHFHRWKNYNGGTLKDYSFDSNGSTQVELGINLTKRGGLIEQAFSADAYAQNRDYWTELAGGHGHSGSTANSSADSTITSNGSGRPLAAVCLIASQS